MKQKLSPAGCASLQRQLCSPSNFINPDEQIIEKMMQAKAVYFWEATAMELSYGRQLMLEGLESLYPEPGWEPESAALLVTADQTDGAGLSLELVEDLADRVLDFFSNPPFTFGTAFADLDIGALRLVLAVSETPVRAPEVLTRFTFGTLTLLAGGTQEEREALLGESTACEDYMDTLLEAARQEEGSALREQLRQAPQLAVSEFQRMDGSLPASEAFSEILLFRYHNDLPIRLSMQYIPKFLDKWFPLDRMHREIL